MGDRTGEDGMLTTGFDGLWGAGKLRLRKYDAAGMDAPAALGWGNTCVDNAESVYHSIPPTGTLPADVDMIKAVIWWYDPRDNDLVEDTGTGHVVRDKVRLWLQWKDGETWTTVAESNTDDNRQRVYLADPENNAEYRIKVRGRDVSYSDTGDCGVDSIRVWRAIYYEDSDRDDGEDTAVPEPLYVRTE